MDDVVIGLANVNVREMKEVLYQWTAPFHVDSSKFTARFDVEAAPFAEGVAATVPWYLAS